MTFGCHCSSNNPNFWLKLIASWFIFRLPPRSWDNTDRERQCEIVQIADGGVRIWLVLDAARKQFQSGARRPAGTVRRATTLRGGSNDTHSPRSDRRQPASDRVRARV